MKYWLCTERNEVLCSVGPPDLATQPTNHFHRTTTRDQRNMYFQNVQLLKYSSYVNFSQYLIFQYSKYLFLIRNHLSLLPCLIIAFTNMSFLKINNKLTVPDSSKKPYLNKFIEVISTEKKV